YDEEWRRHRERCDIWIVEVPVEAWHELRVADRVPDAALELRREGGHPADDHGHPDAIVQRRQVSGANGAHRQSHAADPARIHFRPGEEIVHRADVVPE